ncbi:TadE family type IV pilus minor pilin [Microbacterium sp. CJ77]|uniref:TadE family type IV pilus minor pilin n=1 Tax=Microbacterium sp. CJ77 TaxID=2079201 RepID=UPI0021563383|nr:TadE family type IV pilus minor pilin [Microbacterium sp. CJ77]
MTLPAALLLILVGAGALAAGVQTVRLQGAAADAARLIARGEPQPADVLVGRLAGGAAVRVDEGDGLVCVTLTSPVAVLGLGATGLDVTARACAAAGGR